MPKILTDNEIISFRNRLCDLALEAFANHGVEGITLRGLASSVGCSRTTPYRYFKNKDELMHQLIGAGYEEVYRRYQTIIDMPEKTPLEKLTLIIESYIDFSLSTPNHYKLWFATSQLKIVDNHLHMSHGELSYKVYYVWLDRIDECKADGLFGGRDTLEVFQLLWGSVHGMISLRIQHPKFSWMPVDRHVKHLLAMLQRGLIH